MTKRCSGIIVIGILLAGIAIGGCSRPAGDTPAGTPGETQMVYVDTQTNQAAVMEATDEFPAVNPSTGKRTMMPALYCAQCEQWHAVPPPDQINRIANAALCVKTKTPLTADGPWPDGKVRNR